MESSSGTWLSGDHGTVVNMKIPVTSYANWFSYRTAIYQPKQRD
jgi:hypothetical protein